MQLRLRLRIRMVMVRNTMSCNCACASWLEVEIRPKLLETGLRGEEHELYCTCTHRMIEGKRGT